MAKIRIWLVAIGITVSLTAVLLATVGLAAPSAQPQAVPLFQGPAQGTSVSGATADTGAFPAVAPSSRRGGTGAMPNNRFARIELSGEVASLSSPPEGSNEVDDPAASLPESTQPAATTLLSSFEGLTETSFIPPDPITAAGPKHLTRNIPDGTHHLDARTILG